MNTAATPPPIPRQRRAGSLLRWLLVGLVVLLVLAAALFYPVENWRGKRAWEKCKRELEAKGEVLDWDAYIPPPVPDEQNIFKAPGMAEWFVGRGTNQLARSLDPQNFCDFAQKLCTNVVADVSIVSPDETIVPEKADMVLQYASPVLSIADDSSSDPRSATIPLVIFENVSLHTAIENLARQGEMKYELDPGLKFGSSDRPEPEISRRWEQVSAQQVLFSLLNDYGLRWIDNPKTGVARICRRPSGSPALVYIDPAARDRIQKLIRKSVESSTNDIHQRTARGVHGL